MNPQSQGNQFQIVQIPCRPSGQMGQLFQTIQRLVADQRYVVGEHASERFEERGIMEWQAVAGLYVPESLRCARFLNLAKLLYELDNDDDLSDAADHCLRRLADHQAAHRRRS